MILDEEVYLEHFGVKGMKWGIRNERKVSPEKQAKRENKAKRFDDKAIRYQTGINKVDVKLSKAKRRDYKERLTNQRTSLSRAKDRALSDAEAKRQGKLTSAQKTVATIGAVAATTAGAYAANIIIKNYQTKEIRHLKQTHQDFLAAKKLIDGKMAKRYKALTDLSKMTEEGHASREGALHEIENLNSFYKTRLERMAKEYNVSSDDVKKLKLRSYK